MSLTNIKLISGLQCRLARAATGLGVREVARGAGLSPMAVSRFERGEGTPPPDKIAAIRKLFEDRGVVFTNTDGLRYKPRKT